MKRMIALLLLLALLLPAFGLAADYCECPDHETHQARQQALDRILSSHQTMGASIALIKDGRIVDTFQYGRANRADEVDVDSNTHFRIASVTKMVSAVGVLQLMEQGMIDLDEDISRIFPYTIRNPYYPDTAITLRQIMSHTASLSDQYHYSKATKGDITDLHYVFEGNYTKNNFLRREPGSYVAYSNFGGGMLGSVIEELSGYTVDEYMQAYVLNPLGITAGYHTPCLPHDTYVARVYANDSSGMSMTLDPMAMDDAHYDPDPDHAYVHTAGALLISAEGLAKILIALAGDGSVDGVRILQPETVQAMRTRQDNIGSVTCDAARGLNLNIIENRLANGRTLYGHQGKAYGMICAAYFDPTDQTGVVLLTNGCDTSTVDTVAKIARAVISQAYKYLE